MREPTEFTSLARPNSVHDGILKIVSLPGLCLEVERDIMADLLLGKMFLMVIFEYFGNCPSIQPSDENLDEFGILDKIQHSRTQRELACKEGG